MLSSLAACKEMYASGGYALCALKDNQRCRGFHPDSDGACSVLCNRARKPQGRGGAPLQISKLSQRRFHALLLDTEHAPSESGLKPRHRWLSLKAHSA